MGQNSRRGALGIVPLRETTVIAVLIAGLWWSISRAVDFTPKTSAGAMGAPRESASQLLVSDSGELWVFRCQSGLYRRAGTCERFVSWEYGREADVAIFALGSKFTVAVARHDGVVEVRERESIVFEYGLQDDRDDLTAIDLARDGELLAASTKCGLLLIGRRQDGSWHITTTQAGESLSRLRLSQDGRFAAWRERRNEICVWDVEQNCPVARWSTPHQLVSRLAWAPDGTHLATVGSGGLVCDWDALTGALRWQQKADRFDPLSVAFTVTGQRILTGGFGGRLQFWDAATGAPLGGWTTPHKAVLSIACTAAGEIYTGGLEGQICTWRDVMGWDITGDADTSAREGALMESPSQAY